MQEYCQRLVSSRYFDFSIVTLILLNAVIIGLETSASIFASYHEWFVVLNRLILTVFIIEALLKIVAQWPTPGRYFKNGWNVFDFSIVMLSLIPATGQFAMVARLLRLLRVLRLISTIPELRLIVSTLIRSLPSMGHVIILMGIIFYIYSVLGFHLFHQHDSVHWGNLGLSLLTLFRIVTLEDWTDVMYKAMELHHLAWIYFVSFVILGTFVVVNLFIAVVLNNLEEAKLERKESLQKPADDLQTQLRDAQTMLANLQKALMQRQDEFKR